MNALTAGIGWFAVNTISGTFALSTLTHLPFQVALILIVLLLTGDRTVMGDAVNSRTMACLGWLTFAVMVVAAVGLAVAS